MLDTIRRFLINLVIFIFVIGSVCSIHVLYPTTIINPLDHDISFSLDGKDITIPANSTKTKFILP